MKFHIAQSTLLKALVLADKAIDDSKLFPMLGNYRFKITGNILEITGSNNEVFINKKMPVEADGDICIAVPSEKLLKLLKETPDQPLTFEVVETKIEDKTKVLNLRIEYFGGNCDMPVEDGDDFPVIKTGEKIILKLNSDKFLGCINKTLFAVGKDNLRPAMTGIFLSVENQTATFVATNSTLCSVFEMPVSFEGTADCIVPARVLTIIQGINLGETITLSLSDKNIRFDVDADTSLISVLIAEKFPNYKAVIPDDIGNRLIASKAGLASALRRIHIFANEETALIKFDLAETVKISSNNIDFKQQAEETITGDYVGEEMEIGLSGKFLIQALSKLTADDIHFSFQSPNRAVVFRESDTSKKSDLVLLMPMMLNPVKK